MSFETQIHLLLSELISELRANDSDTFRRWLSGGTQDLGQPVVKDLMLEWMNPLLTVEEMDRLVGWHLMLMARFTRHFVSSHPSVMPSSVIGTAQ